MYFMALLFRLFGTDVATARLATAVLHGVARLDAVDRLFPGLHPHRVHRGRLSRRDRLVCRVTRALGARAAARLQVVGWLAAVLVAVSAGARLERNVSRLREAFPISRDASVASI